MSEHRALRGVNFGGWLVLERWMTPEDSAFAMTCLNLFTHVTKRWLAHPVTNLRIADLSTNHYAQIERGEANPSIETLEAILKALNVKSSKILPF